jgi:2,3-bisphosphoglycerate-dependent phosphoglycerate mutase
MGIESKDGILVLIRHGESQWNAINQWTGLTDIGLSEKGKHEAVSAAKCLADISFDYAYTSKLSRASNTLKIILDTLHATTVPVISDSALNERDYGVYTGKNKLEIKEQIGDEAYLALRRGWDTPVPQGESLKQVYDRVIPYYTHTIAPQICQGNNILIVAHGNSLRALIKYIEHIKDEDIAGVELATGEIILYKINSDGVVVSRQKRIASI